MKKILYTIGLALGLAALTGCTDLTEKNFSNIDAGVYYQNEASVKGAIASIYSSAAYGFCEYFFYLQEFSADQVAWRTWNGGNWGWDEGLKFVLSSHTWTSEATIVLQAWQSAWKTIGMCNQLIQDLGTINPADLGMTADQMEAYIAEVRTLRAWAYYNNYELWGGALPLCTAVTSEVPGSIDADFQTGCRKMFDFIADELDQALPHLVNKGSQRVSPAMNRMLKMRLLLNSEVFTGTPRFDECAILAQDLMDGKYGTYSIVPDYRTIFEMGNEACPEVVFAFAEMNGQLNTGWMRNMPGLPYNYTEFTDCYATNQSGWNCVCLAPSYDNAGNELSTPAINASNEALMTDAAVSFLDSKYGDKLGAVYARFEPGDIRRQSYSFPNGGRWNGGQILKGKMNNILTGEDVLADADREGQPLIYVDQVGQFAGATALGQALADVQSPRWGQTNSGYRLIKYPLYPTSTGIDYQDISEVEFRWAEVVYTLAECKIRQGDVEGGKALVNSVRSRYFTGAMTDLAASWSGEEWMLHQWGIEFLSEGRRRRTDLRRFDKFTQGQWWFFGRAIADNGSIFPVQRDRKYEWFPLPQSALGVNPGLKQNPNY